MKSLIGGFIGLVLSVHVGAEPLLEGRVRLASGQPAADVQVRLVDLTDLRRSVGTTTDAAGYFVLSLQTLSGGTALPTDFALGQNYPNPFNPSTVIPYQLPASGHVRLDVFNVLGQRLATLVDAERSAGAHTAQWDGTDASGRAVGAGVYIYRLSSGGMMESRRMVLVDGQAGIPAIGAATQGPVRSKVEGAVEADGSVYGLTVSGEGLVAYVNPTFRVGVDAADIVIEEHGGNPRMKLTTGRILGDVNNDGQVDSFDALYVLLYSEDSSITLPNNGDISLGDVNGDGQVDLADAVLLATYSVNPSDPTLPPGIGQAVPDLVTSSGTSEGQDTILSHIYWIAGVASNNYYIQRANLDGSNIETLATGLNNVSGIALDADGGKIYWTDWKSWRRIRRANLDGSNIETLIITGHNPLGIALDVDGGKIYWTNSRTNHTSAGIRRANLDGSNIETLVTDEGWFSGIALDVDGYKMYWMDWLNNSIQRANLDGSDIETLIITGHNPFDIALDVDGYKMYWVDWGNDNIQRANLDGSNIETLVTGSGFPRGITLNLGEGKMYWMNGGSIQRADLDGSNIETLVTGLDLSVSVALGPYYELTNPEETPTRSREEARSELAERGIPYSQRSFVTYAQNGELDVVRLFVEAGLDVNVQPYSSSTVLIPKQEHVEQLDDLEAVWFPQDGDEDNDTALMKAAGQGHIEVVRFLVEQGADLNIRNSQGQNALMFAAAGGHLAMVIFLLDSGGYTSERRDPIGYSYNHGPKTSLMWAAYNGHLDVVNLLIEYAKIVGDSFVYNFSASLGWAAYRGHLDVVNLLLEYGVELNPRPALGKKRGSGTTALMLAAYGGQLEVVRFLLEKGADIHVRTANWLPVQTDRGTIYFQEIGASALTLAIDQGHAEVVRLLLEHWMWEYSADGRDDHGLTALMYAAAAGDLEMAHLLLQNEAPVNAQTDIGTTALMFAAAFGRVEVVRLLVENGADIHIQNGHNYTALSLAEERGHQEVVDFLRSEEDAG